MPAGARFCNECGAPAHGSATTPAAAPGSWGGTGRIVGVVILLLIAFVAGQQIGSHSTTAVADAPQAGPFAGGGRAPDISNMTPEEAASRLFDRVMRYASEGKADSAQMFAPMAMLAYERIGPLDAHARYDIGTIAAVTNDAQAAGAQADTILKAQPSHLLGLLLAARAADLRKDSGAAARFRARFSAALATERAKGLKEYTDHQRDIDQAASPAKK